MMMQITIKRDFCKPGYSTLGALRVRITNDWSVIRATWSVMEDGRILFHVWNPGLVDLTSCFLELIIQTHDKHEVYRFGPGSDWICRR